MYRESLAKDIMIKNGLIIVAIAGVLVLPAYADGLGPKGCPGGYSIARPTGGMAHFCPTGPNIRQSSPIASLNFRYPDEYKEIWQHGAERIKRQRASLLGGHASPSHIGGEPMPQSPTKCLAAIQDYLHVGGNVSVWFDRVIYGKYNGRVLTGQAALRVRDRLLNYISREIGVAKEKYAAAYRGQKQNTLCTGHIADAKRETLRVFNLVKAEAAKGNRDLEGTGLNSGVSVYNK